LYFTDRGIEELETRKGDDEVTLAWLADQLRAFVDLNPEFEVPIERLATWLARLDDPEGDTACACRMEYVPLSFAPTDRIRSVSRDRACCLTTEPAASRFEPRPRLLRPKNRTQRVPTELRVRQCYQGGVRRARIAVIPGVQQTSPSGSPSARRTAPRARHHLV
jgi:hypothetical protein